MSRITGQQAEQRACRYLKQQGLALLAQNYHSRRGEIDLVMQQGSELVFVEVKFRTSDSHGRASEYFTATKRKKFEAALQQYMLEHSLNPAMVAHRIDVVAIDNDNIQWYRAV